MDTGKILMGMAMLLITIGLLVHPAGAAETGSISIVGQGNAIGGTGPAPGCSDITCVAGSGSSFPATYPYERLTTSPVSLSVNTRVFPTSNLMDMLPGG
jgi:hypothetical protein